jgi:hypothetical protein
MINYIIKLFIMIQLERSDFNFIDVPQPQPQRIAVISETKQWYWAKMGNRRVQIYGKKDPKTGSITYLLDEQRPEVKNYIFYLDDLQRRKNVGQ